MSLTVFLGSPEDAADARATGRQVLQELPRTPAFRGEVLIDTFTYDDPLAPTPLSATLTPQQSIAKFGTRPKDCDFTLIFLWSRMGTPLPLTELTADGRRFRSGTEWEIEDARSAGKDVFVFVRDEPPPFSRSAEGDAPVQANPELAAKQAQHKQLRDYLDSYRDGDGALRGALIRYPGPGELRTLLTQHLSGIVRRRLDLHRARLEAGRRLCLRKKITLLMASAASVIAVAAFLIHRYVDRPTIRLEDVPFCDVDDDDRTVALHLSLTYEILHDIAGDKAYLEIAANRSFPDPPLFSRDLSANKEHDLNIFPSWSGLSSPWNGWLRIAIRDPQQGVRDASRVVPLRCNEAQ